MFIKRVLLHFYLKTLVLTHNIPWSAFKSVAPGDSLTGLKCPRAISADDIAIETCMDADLWPNHPQCAQSTAPVFHKQMEIYMTIFPYFVHVFSSNSMLAC